MERREDLPPASEQAKALPSNPGCYLMRDAAGTVIYVGKAKNLHRRVGQYFMAGRDAKTRALVAKIARIEFIATGNEYEALVLENNLIKRHSPRYNILLKDGKSYPVIKITNEPFPKVCSTRRILDDGARYYGPFPDAALTERFLALIDRLFSFRKCKSPLKVRERPCLYHHIGRCPAPCCGLVTQEEYARNVEKVADLLEGRSGALRKSLEAEMEKAAREMDYEGAARKRDLIRAIEAVTTEQEAEEHIGEELAEESRDYVAIEARGTLCAVCLMQIRRGKLIGKAVYRASTLGTESETVLDFLMGYYGDGRELPRELFVSCETDLDLVADFFAKELDSPVKVLLPTTGKHYRILRMAAENAKRDVEALLRSADNTQGLQELAEALALEGPPGLIEGFDVAQLSGKHTVASLISFKDGNPDPKNYRRFNIKSLDGAIDDFASIAEAVGRRARRIVSEDLPRPDLFLIDGGKGQVNAARRALDEGGLADVPAVGLAERRETIVFDDDRPDLNLPLSSEALRILIAVRDECHRFATKANRAMRSKEVSFKVLQSVPGIGPKTSGRLMAAYESIDALLEDGPEAVARKAGISKELAERLARRLDLG